MTDADLEKLTRAAAQLDKVTELLSEDPDVPESILALLTAGSGCFTTLIHIADLLGEIHTAMLFSRMVTKKEMMQ